jgi:hypothetical protein
MGGIDWIPGPDEDFDPFYKKYCQTVGANTAGANPLWPHIPKAWSDALMERYAAWYTAWGKLKAAHTSGDVLAKNEERARGEDALRNFNRRYILNAEEVTNAQRRDIGCPVHSDERHRIEPPHTAPVLLPRAGTPGQIIVPYRDEASMRRGKPKDVHGIEIRWGILDHEPSTREELIHSSFDTHSPLYLNFGEEDRGKRVYMYGCWEIEREGEKGPPGEIVSCFIP